VPASSCPIVVVAVGSAIAAAPFWKYSATPPSLGTAVTSAPFVK
jgi:hypothetical protein